jgi:hypothetical protein
VALDEPRDRCVVRPLLGRQDPERDVLLAGPLDRPRRSNPARVRVEQPADHHRRVIGGPAATVAAIRAIERLQSHLRDGVDHEPHEVVLRQPVADIRRHQKRLLAITRDEALAHHEIVLTSIVQ